MPIIETRRGGIHYKDYRKNSSINTPYLLIHGAGSQYMDFPSLMRRSLEAIALDLSGHGSSPKHDSSSIEDYAEDVIAFLDTLNLEKVIVVGHSMGGGIAQQIALDYPERLQGLILIATGAKLAVNPSIIEGILTHPEETARSVTKWSWGDFADDDLIEQGIQHLLQTPLEVIQTDYIACNQFDVRDRLSEIKIKTLIIAGAKDKMTRLEGNQEIADNIPNSQIEIFAECGHMVHVEQTEAVIDLVQDWSEKI
ncbi:MAG: alpha/beta hydrolase [Phototrophicaceae bacterium]